MRVLVIGSGGREHALAWKLSKSPHVSRVYCAPGNAGMSDCATCHNVSVTDCVGFIALARRESIGLTVVGPEAALAAGVVDAFRREGLPIFGPTQRAAELESSKAFAKTFMQTHGVPTAHYGVFTEAETARAFARREALPLVIKADGLAAGKGVIIAHTTDEVDHAIHMLLANSGRIVIEQFLVGEEISCIALVCGQQFVLLEPARDHKTVHDGDTGPNTGGMGAFTPTQLWTPALAARVQEEIFVRTTAGLCAEGRDFVGFLYAGLMVVDGAPYCLEFNVRLGDPEAQALLFRLRSDLLPWLHDAAAGSLPDGDLVWDARASVCVVMASHGYPGDYTTGHVIHGLDRVQSMSDTKIFHAGTVRQHNEWRTAGGRVLGVTALGDTMAAARDRAYTVVDQIAWDGAFCRRDIGIKK